MRTALAVAWLCLMALIVFPIASVLDVIEGAGRG